MQQSKLTQFDVPANKIYSLMPKPYYKPFAQKNHEGKQSFFSLIIVLLTHIVAIYFVLQQSIAPMTRIEELQPMLVSLIAPPTQNVATVIEPTTPKSEAKTVIVKELKKILPIQSPVVRQIEGAPQVQVTENTVLPEASPALESASATQQPVAALQENHSSQEIEPPRFGVAYLNNPAPDYPKMARRAGEQGRVLMRVLVSADGAAEDVQIEKSSGSALLDHAALAAVKKWRFIPAKQNNQPLSAYVLVPMKFSLDS